MAIKLYIIDCTSRQYPINISDQGASLTVDGETITFYEHNIPVQVFENAILQKLPFTISTHEQTVIYNSTNLIGVQIIKA